MPNSSDHSPGMNFAEVLTAVGASAQRDHLAAFEDLEAGVLTDSPLGRAPRLSEWMEAKQGAKAAVAG